MSVEYNPVGWFEIPVKDMSRAKTFYEHVLDIQVEEHEMGPLQMAWFPMDEKAIGATGSLVKGGGYEPSMAGTLIYFTVTDIDVSLARAEEKGGRILMPKTSIGEYGFIGHCVDCEGNRVGLHSKT